MIFDLAVCICACVASHSYVACLVLLYSRSGILGACIVSEQVSKNFLTFSLVQHQYFVFVLVVDVL